MIIEECSYCFLILVTDVPGVKMSFIEFLCRILAEFSKLRVIVLFNVLFSFAVVDCSLSNASESYDVMLPLFRLFVNSLSYLL